MTTAAAPGPSFVAEDQSAALAAALRLLGGPGQVERIDTHGAVVFLAGDRAWKMKRAVRFPYMDFGDRARRRAMSFAEVAVNRRVAPELYLGVAPLMRDGSGARFGPVREPDEADPDIADALEWFVAMRRFDQHGLLAHLAAEGRLGADLVVALARRVAEFHDAAPRSAAFAGPAEYRHAVETDIAQMRLHADALDRENGEALARAMPAALEPLLGLVARRRDLGAVRRCHGDLHLRNVCLVDGKPTPFDAIEFSDRIATIDVLYDLAFLVMDLDHRGLRGHANLALNHWLWRVGDVHGAGHFEALALLPLFLARRGAIRAYVDAAASKLVADPAGAASVAAAARAYQRGAARWIAPPPPCLVAVGGLSGTGKTTLAMALAPALGATPGAVVLRSDVVRKRMAGVALEQRLPPGSYTPGSSAAVYAALADAAGQALRAGHAAIVDAVFAGPAERAAIARVAEAAGVPFHGLWLEAPSDQAKRRVAARVDDASDAGPAVVDRQLGYAIGAMDWARLDAGRDAAFTERQARAALGLGEASRGASDDGG